MMIIKFDLESELFSHIQNMIKSGRYDDIYQFIKIAINNQLQEELSQDQQKEEKMILFSEPQSENRIQIEKISDLQKYMENIPIQESEIPKPQEDLIWSFYTRFFPVKVVIYHLARMLNPQNLWIEISHLQERTFGFAEDICRRIEAYEEDHNLTREKKLSTGLPMTLASINLLKGAKRRKYEEKYQSSKRRFMEQIIGKPVKKGGVSSFSGACFSMGLLAVKFGGEECFVSLTKNGRDFVMWENPILDGNDFAQVFSDDEARFILTRIYPLFPIENKVIQEIISALKNKDMKSQEIDVIFKKEQDKIFNFYSNEPHKLSTDRKKDIITQARVATMGRLSELKIVNWKLGKDGSVYSLNKDRVHLL